MDLPAPYVARPYRGPADHAAMVSILGDYHVYCGDSSQVTEEQMSVMYSSLTNCDPATDVVVVEAEGVGPVAYVRTSWEEHEDGSRVYVLFFPMRPDHIVEPLYRAMVAAQEAHMQPIAEGFANSKFWAFAPHPGPGQSATSGAAWLESLGYTAIRFEAHLVRPDLENIPELPLPDGVEVRAVTPEMIRPIWEAHSEAFRGSFGFHEETDVEIQRFVDDPLRDESLWKVAWVGDTIVGQVKSYINPDENAEMGYLRGYTEHISTHADWRNQGIAGALLTRSLEELKDRGMTEAALGADTQNPGGAFQLYTKLGFELRAYEAVYAKPLT